MNNLFLDLGLKLFNHKQEYKDNINDRIFEQRMKSEKLEYEVENLDDDDNYFFRNENVRNTKKREYFVRQILENLFGKPFASCRPKFLMNPHTKRRLEIDCFNPDLRLAVEVQGEGHYYFIPHFHRTFDKYEEMVKRDIMKRKMIREKGLKFIEVPYNIHNNVLEKYIIQKCFELNVFPKN